MRVLWHVALLAFLWAGPALAETVTVPRDHGGQQGAADARRRVTEGGAAGETHPGRAGEGTTVRKVPAEPREGEVRALRRAEPGTILIYEEKGGRFERVEESARRPRAPASPGAEGRTEGVPPAQGEPGEVLKGEEEPGEGAAAEEGEEAESEPEEQAPVVSGFRYPADLFEPLWLSCRQALSDRSMPALRSALHLLYEAKLDTGFRNAPIYATLLIREAYRAREEDDVVTARLLAETAHSLAPDFPPAARCLARLSRGDPERGWVRSLGWVWASWVEQARSFLWQYRSAGRAFVLTLVFLYLIFLLQGVYFLFRYGRLLLHVAAERVPAGPFGLARIGVLTLASGLVLLLLPGPIWVVVLAGFLCARVSRRWERVCFGGSLIIWAMAPWALSLATDFFSPLPDPARAVYACIQGNWDAGSEAALQAGLERHPDSRDLLWVEALVEKRRGAYRQAMDVAERAVKMFPEEGAIWNNVGNIRAVQGDLAGAQTAYHRAIRVDGSLAAPHYNLSQVLRKEFLFFEGARAFQEARRLDPERVDAFVYIQSQQPNRFLMDVEPGVGSVWRHVLSPAMASDEVIRDLWRLASAGLPLEAGPWVFALFAGMYVLLVTRRRTGDEPFGCSGCGKVVCSRCQTGREVGGLCSPCYQALYQRREVSKDRRQEQIRRMAVHQASRSRRWMVLNIPFPGLGVYLAAGRPTGLLFLFGFLLALFAVIFWGAILPVPGPVWEEGGGVVRWFLGALLVAVYGASQYRFRKQLMRRR